MKLLMGWHCTVSFFLFLLFFPCILLVYLLFVQHILWGLLIKKKKRNFCCVPHGKGLHYNFSMVYNLQNTMLIFQKIRIPSKQLHGIKKPVMYSTPHDGLLSYSAQVLFFWLLSNILLLSFLQDLCNTKPYPRLHAMAPIKVSVSIKASRNRDWRDISFISAEFWFHIPGKYSWTRRRESTFGFICVSFIFYAIIPL